MRCVFAFLLCIYAVLKVLCFILSDDDFEIKSKIYNLNCACLVLFIFSIARRLYSSEYVNKPFVIFHLIVLISTLAVL